MPNTSFRQSLDAILFACGGWFCFCLCDAMSKWLVGRYGAFEILAICGAVGTLICSVWIIMAHGPRAFATPKWKWYLLRGLTQCLSSYCAIRALSTTPLADFYGIIFLTPMATALLATFVLGEKIGIYRILAIIIGFAGVLIIAGPSFGNHNIGYLFALGSVACASISAMVIRKIGHEPIIARYAFFPFIVMAAIYIPVALQHGMTMPQSTSDLFFLLIFAPISIIGVLGYSMGFARARETAIVAPFHYTQMIWGIIIGFVIFHDVPALNTLLGSLAIIAAGGVIIWRERVHHVQIASTAAETPV